MKPSGNVATLIEYYFTERLMRQRNVSANTIASYRDTFRLLFTFAQARLASLLRPWLSAIWMRLSLATSSRISRQDVAPASGHATCA